MKKLTLSFVLSMIILLGFSQNHDNLMPLFPNRDIKPAISENSGSASILNMNQRNASYDRTGTSYDKCEKYKRMKISGIVSSSVGGALFIGGIAMIAVGVHNVTGYDAYGNPVITNQPMANAGLVGGGVVCLILGMGGLGAGIPLAIIGSVKTRKYCNGGANLKLNTSPNGLGLAMQF